MKYDKFIKEAARLAEPYRVTKGEKFRLKDYDPAGTGGVKSKRHAQQIVDRRIGLLSDMQEKLYAQDRWALLVILQAMDAAGKDSVIKHVMSGVNPQGCEVYSFKAPSTEELNHDYLWRTMRAVPERGRIGIFNRSYYEEVLVVRVHSELLKNERIPPSLITKKIWDHRFEDICAFEKYLTRNGIIVRKFLLNVSKKEQKQRFLARLDQPEKNWKFSIADIHEREYWDDYMGAYEDMIRKTAAPEAPWYVVPADHKWFTRLVVAEAVVDTLEGLDLAYPRVDADKRKELEAARKLLMGNK